ncbi:MAG: hypothetical protein PGN11_20700 [Quadrisphaera sp.]
MSERQFRLASVLAVAGLLFVGLAVVVWYLPVQAPDGRCGRAIDFHFGHHGYHQGGMVDAAERQRRLSMCRGVVAGTWRGGVALAGAGAAALVMVVWLAVCARDRRPWLPAS